MKNKKIGASLSVMAIVVLAAGYAISLSPRVSQNADGLLLSVESDKTDYLPGDTVLLKFRITNKSNTPTSIYKGSTVWDGYLKVFIAKENSGFREYFGPAWGAKDAHYKEPITLAPGNLYETDATVLWNQKLETSHLGKMYAKKVEKERLTTDYALAEPGTYYIKASLLNPLTNHTVESEPIEVRVNEPEGADLEVWNRIKVDGNYGLFIQTGGLPEHRKGPKTLKLAKDLEILISQHPSSRYSKSIRSSLTKRQELIERIEPKNPLEE
ncbi:MAG TPA: hypothetical protein VJU84_13560 [Pyrinomonadaceae bacterium]|nr:hypothetical protein [Pyrinomonadaceae bacterium]